jgi:hypothetical protein
VTAISHVQTASLYLQLASLKERKTKLQSARDYLQRFREYLETKQRMTLPFTKYLWTIDKQIRKEEVEIAFRIRVLYGIYHLKSDVPIPDFHITTVSLEPSSTDPQRANRTLTTKEKLPRASL